MLFVFYLLDIDECRDQADLCPNGSCRNLAGTYICDCDSGYQRSVDGKECEGQYKCAIIHSACFNFKTVAVVLSVSLIQTKLAGDVACVMSNFPTLLAVRLVCKSILFPGWSFM